MARFGSEKIRGHGIPEILEAILIGRSRVALERSSDRARTVFGAGTASPIVAFPDELLSEAVARMLASDIGRLPVVSREDPKRLVGYLGRFGVMNARVRLYEEENVRERGTRPR